MAELDCNQVLRDIYFFLDGELTVEVKAAIRTHLHGCINCLEVYDFEAELRHVVSEHCTHDEVPAELRQRIAGLIGMTPPPGSAGLHDAGGGLSAAH